MKKLILAAALILAGNLTLSAQTDGIYYWKVLSKLNFASKYNAETGDISNQPIFSKEVQALKGKDIYLKGYILPVPSRDGTVILSAFPFSSCFYCGQAGPESVIEVHPRFPIISRGNKPVLLKGKLDLNEPYDMLVLPYFLMDAEPVSE